MVTVANRRKDYTVGVKIKGSGGNFICDKSLLVRVALGTDKGTAFGAGTKQAQLDAYGWTDTSPISFTTANASLVNAVQLNWGTTVSVNDKRLFTGTTSPGGCDASVEWIPPGGPFPGIYGVGVAASSWDWNKEELDAYIEHEKRHLYRDNSCLVLPTGNWRLLYDTAGAGVYVIVTEADAHYVHISENVSYRFLGDPSVAVPPGMAAPAGSGGFLWYFKEAYDSAKASLGSLTGSLKGFATNLLQTEYDSVPCPEMKDPNYSPSISPP